MSWEMAAWGEVDEGSVASPAPDQGDATELATWSLGWWLLLVVNVAIALAAVLLIRDLLRRRRRPRAIGPGVSWPDYEYLEEDRP